MKFLSAMLSEDGSPDNISTMRVCSALCVVVVLGTWAAVSIQQKALQPLTAEQTAIVLGALGIKAWQRGVESSSAKASSFAKATEDKPEDRGTKG